MISGSAIVRASIARFIPGVLLFLGCCLYMTALVKGITLGPAQISGFSALTVFMTLGFGASLLPMRFVLPSKAGVTGRLGLLAGFSSPMVLLALEMLYGGPVSHSLNYTFAFIAGSVTTIALFAPRISITPVWLKTSNRV